MSPEAEPTAGSRRDLLKKMAAAGAIGSLVPTIVSTTAFADSGTVACRFTYTTAATATIVLSRPRANQATVVITIANPTGTCPCSPATAPTFNYSYFANLGGAVASTGWVTFSSASGTFTVAGTGSYAYSVEAGVRAQCPGKRALTFLCRFVLRSGTTSATGAATDGPTAMTATSSPNLPTC